MLILYIIYNISKMFITNELIILAIILALLIFLMMFTDNINNFVGSSMISPESIQKSLNQI